MYSDPNWVCWWLNWFTWILHLSTVTSLLLSCILHAAVGDTTWELFLSFSITLFYQCKRCFEMSHSNSSSPYVLKCMHVCINCICLLRVFGVFFVLLFLSLLPLILFVSFCLTQQSSLLDCISQSCISACCNLVPWSNKVLCPHVGPSSCRICSLMLLPVAFSIYAILFCSLPSVVTCCFFLLRKKAIKKKTSPMPGLFLLCSSVLLLVCSTVSCIYLLHRIFYSLFCLLTFASFETPPPMDTVFYLIGCFIGF